MGATLADPQGRRSVLAMKLNRLCSPCRALQLALSAFLLGVATPGPLQAGLEPTAATREALTRLHQGRFDEAASSFREISQRRREDPEGPLFEALTAWWRLLDIPDDPEIRPVLEERLGEAIRRGEDLIEAGDTQRGKIFAGTAYLLAAQTRAFSGSYLSAGRAARAGHRLLEEALSSDSGAADARFAMGAYKYFAARLPWLVRLLRVFIRLPGGSIEEGLSELSVAAADGSYFRTEALLLLTYIYSEDGEEDTRRGLDYLREARELEPDSPLLTAIEARLLFAIGRLDEAERTARAAMEMAERIQGVAPGIPALARLRVALALYYQYRPKEAMEMVGQLDSGRAHLSPEARDSLDRLDRRLRRDLGLGPAAVPEPIPGAGGRDKKRSTRLVAAAPMPPSGPARAALATLRAGRPDEAATALARATVEAPEDPVLRYHLARAHQMAGDHEKATEELRRLLSSGVKLPKTLRGWALIRMGAALEASGHHDRARSYFREGSTLRGFVFSRAATDRLMHPEESFFPEG
jgi:tetratricopeptide (TPR) repeat protein